MMLAALPSRCTIFLTASSRSRFDPCLVRRSHVDAGVGDRLAAAAKRKAKGYRTKRNLKAIVYLIAGDVLANSPT